MSSQALTTPRSALFVPADAVDKHARAFASGADAVIVDLEDAVALEAKEGARAGLVETLADRAGPSLALVRINSPLTEHGRGDLEAVPQMGADGVVVPKADPESIEAAAGLGLPLVALVETAAGVLRAAETAAHPAVSVLMLGPVDLSLELGVKEAPGGEELSLARGQLALAAAAAGKAGPLDGPCVLPRDGEALALEIERAQRAGFAGKSCIHPAQVEPVNAAFSPSEEEVAWARRVLDAFGDGAAGALALDGEMIDLPVAERARRILAKAAAD